MSTETPSRPKMLKVGAKVFWHDTNEDLRPIRREGIVIDHLSHLEADSVLVARLSDGAVFLRSRLEIFEDK